METVQHLIAHYGYAAVFIGAVLEGEMILVTAAFFAARGVLDVSLVWLIAASGAFTGHILFFRIGRWKGPGWLFSHRRLGPAARKADQVITRFGWSSIFLLQYLYGTRLAGALLFGISSFTFPRFLVLQAINCLSWAALVTAVGYFLGASIEAALYRLGWISAGIVVLVAVVTWLIWRKKSR